MITVLTSEQRIERTIQALCDELRWGLRYFYAYKALHQTELRLTPTLFDTFYFSCLDQACLILSRMVIVREKLKDDDSVNLRYFLEQAKSNSSLFHFANSREVAQLIETHYSLLESYKPVLTILKEQRDRNLAHLDKKHVEQPEWRENQTQLVLDSIEQLYRDLIGVMATYHRLFYGKEFVFGDWQVISQSEVETLIAFYKAYQSTA